MFEVLNFVKVLSALLSTRKHRSVLNVTKWQEHYAKYGRKTYQKIKEKRLKQCAEYYQKNKERYREVGKIWRSKNPDKTRKAWKKYQAKNKEKCLTRNREWYARNKEAQRLRVKRYRENGGVRFLESKKIHNKKSYLRHRKSRIQRVKDYQKKPHVIARRKAYMKAYRIEHSNRIYSRKKESGQDRAHAAKRRAQKKSSEVNEKWIKQYMWEVLRWPLFNCYYCQKTHSIVHLEFDHVIPYAKKGPHEIGNIALSCATCNRSKNDKLISQWKREGQLMLGI